MIRGIQIFGLLISIFLIIKTFHSYYRRDYAFRDLILWTTVWTGVGIVFIYPDVIGVFLIYLTLEQRLLAGLVLGLTFIYLLMFRLYQMHVNLERKVTELVQEIAVNLYERGNKTKSKTEVPKDL